MMVKETTRIKIDPCPVCKIVHGKGEYIVVTGVHRDRFPDMIATCGR